MKKLNFLSFLLGGLTFLTIGAGVPTSTDVLTVKPAVPKSTVTSTVYYKDASSFISKHQNNGYVLKQIVCLSTSYDLFIVMEKY